MNSPETQDFRAMTADTIGKDLLGALVTEIKLLPDVWPKMSKSKQDDVIDRLRARVYSNVRMAVHMLAAEGRIVVAGDLDQITIKDGVKAVVKFGSNAVNLQQLYSEAGKAVLIVVANAGDHILGMDEIQGEADQRAMDLGNEYDPKGDGKGMDGNVVDADVVEETKALPAPGSSGPTKEQLEDAYEDGYQAAYDGKKQSDSPFLTKGWPFPVDARQTYWVDGWKQWHKDNQTKTAKLGELPNEHGVYVCEPDEMLEWKANKSHVEIKLLELETGTWLYAMSIQIGTSSSSGPLKPSADDVNSREEALRQAQKRLYEITAKGENSGLKGKEFNDFRTWVYDLVAQEEQPE